MNRAFFLLILLLISTISTIGHAQKYNLGITATPKAGFLLVHHQGKMSHLLNQHVYGIDLGVTLQTNGTKQWHHDFLFPQIHFNASYLSVGNREILGESYGIEGGIYLPFVNKNGWTFGPRLGVGLAYVTKRYDNVENPKNNAIGSHVNCLVNIGLRIEKQFNQHAIGLNVMMAHLSNGAVKLPNLGLNMPILGLHYTYYLSPLRYEYDEVKNDVIQEVKTWSFFTQLISSTKQIYPTGGSNYGIIALANYAQYKFTKKFVMEGGLDLTYNQSIIKAVEGDWGREKNFQVGVYTAFIVPVHRFQLYGGIGGYVLNPLNPDGMIYHRLGGRFQFTKRLWGNISIKSHWGRADYFEYGLAYRWL